VPAASFPPQISSVQNYPAAVKVMIAGDGAFDFLA